MELVYFGIPKEETIFIKNEMGLDVFVEGGTYLGNTAKAMSYIFRKVFTIEKSEIMFKRAEENLKNFDNVELLMGDTREYFGKILQSNDNILFWLDSHWSGGDTYGENDECPLMDELKIIFKYRKNYVILIDDARLFMAPPPKPHKIENWPSIKDIVNILPHDWDLIVYNDVIYLFPNNFDRKFKDFIQEKVTLEWIKLGRKESFMKGIKIAVKSLLKCKIW